MENLVPLFLNLHYEFVIARIGFPEVTPFEKVSPLMNNWALAHYFFETSFHPDLIPVLILGLIVCALSVIIGLVNSVGLLNRPPLEVLRQEV